MTDDKQPGRYSFGDTDRVTVEIAELDALLDEIDQACARRGVQMWFVGSEQTDSIFIGPAEAGERWRCFTPNLEAYDGGVPWLDQAKARWQQAVDQARAAEARALSHAEANAKRNRDVVGEAMRGLGRPFGESSRLLCGVTVTCSRLLPDGVIEDRELRFDWDGLDPVLVRIGERLPLPDYPPVVVEAVRSSSDGLHLSFDVTAHAVNWAAYEAVKAFVAEHKAACRETTTRHNPSALGDKL